jgi:YhcH/YjgK/YiaL family protein
MIVDKISNAVLYEGISSEIAKCFSYIKNADFDSMTPFRKDLNEKITVVFSENNTKAFDEKSWEAHDHCIDLQYVAEGCESLAYANRSQLKFVEKTEGKDKLVYTGDGARILLEKGFFVILFPEDGHKSKLHAGGPQKVQKLVFKIKI